MTARDGLTHADFARLWRQSLGRRVPLPLAGQPCQDCSARTIYAGIVADMQAELPPAAQVQIALRGWCEHEPDVACRGTAEDLGIVNLCQAPPPAPYPFW
jgi:hypothetical protein